MKLLIAGDIYLGRRLKNVPARLPEEIFGPLHQSIIDSDLAIFNLEGPITDEENPLPKTGPALKMRTDAARFLQAAGFDIAALANNHIFDFGVKGLRQTLAELGTAGLAYLGAGLSPTAAAVAHTASIDGETLGILNFAENEWSTTRGTGPGANPVDVIANFRAIHALKAKVDYVVVICHGGHEMCRLPSPEMRERLRFYVEAGADGVFNHHQHVVSGFEFHQGSPIFYGLGNCLFDGGISPPKEWTEGIAIELILSMGKIDVRKHHFDQCQGEMAIAACSDDEVLARDQKIGTLSDVIGDEALLKRAFLEELQARERRYRAHLMPVQNRYLQALHNRGLFPGLLSRRKKRLYLNLIRCESHREALTWLLERDLSN